MMNEKGNEMNSAEKLRTAHNLNTFGMSRGELEALVEANADRLPMFVAGLLSDIQELLVSSPDSNTRSELIRKQLNVAKFALFEAA